MPTKGKQSQTAFFISLSSIFITSRRSITSPLTHQFTEDQWLQWVDTLSDQEYVVIDDFLSEELYKGIRAFFEERQHQDAFDKAAIGALQNNQINTAVRGDFTYWLSKERDTQLQQFWELLDELMFVMNRYCYLSLSDYEFHLAHYPVGTFYKRHLDQFVGRNNRMISVVIYLNENWTEGDGGELQVYLASGDVKIQPKARRCVLFKSADVEHEVLATHVGRDSLTGWLLYKPAGLGLLA